MRKEKGKKENLLQHLRGLVEGNGRLRDDATLAWSANFPADGLSDERIQGIRDVVALGATFGRIGASWSVVDLEMN